MTTNEFTKLMPKESIDALFLEAHTQRSFQPEKLDRSVVDRVYDVIRWAPTAYNASAMRITVVESPQARERLVAHMSQVNKEHVKNAPLALVISYDRDFSTGMVEMGSPQQLADSLAGNDELALQTATMQVAYLILGLRGAGLHVGPMTGGDFNAIHDDLFQGTSLQPFMVLVVGSKPTDPGYRPRKGRLSAEQVVSVI